jgi:HlyD family secretion protein
LKFGWKARPSAPGKSHSNEHVNDEAEKSPKPSAPNPKKRRITIWIVVAVGGACVYFALSRHPRQVIITGIVTTDEVIASSEIQGRLAELKVKQGDEVKRGQLLAEIQPKEWEADMAYYAGSQLQSASQVTQAQADLAYQEATTSNQIREAEANLASAQAQIVQAKADLENARLTFTREEQLYHEGAEPVQAYDQARTANDAAKARVESLEQQAQSTRAAVDLARASSALIGSRQAGLEASTNQLAAMTAQKNRAQIRLDYTRITAPIDGVVDQRAALQGEVVNSGQPIVTLINPDDLWVRADIEEGYIDRIKLGQKVSVRLPSGAMREGTVFFRGVDADFATQRDVSRTKRDIKTFEIRVRCDNQDRALAVGMSAYVTLPLPP